MTLIKCKKFFDPYVLANQAVGYDANTDKSTLSKKIFPKGPSYDDLLTQSNGDLPEIYKRIVNILEIDILENFLLGSIEDFAKAIGKEICLKDIESIATEITSFIRCYLPSKDGVPKAQLTELPSFFNLFKALREDVIRAIEVVMGQIIISLLEALLPLLDRNFLNKYLFPHSQNSSENRAAEATHYQADDIFKSDIRIAIAKAIATYGLNLTVEEYYLILEKITKSFNARELNAVFHAALNGQLFQIIKGLIVSVIGGTRLEQDSDYVFLLEILEQDIEFGLFQIENQNISLCGNPPNKNSDGSLKEIDPNIAEDVRKKVTTICDIMKEKVKKFTNDTLGIQNSPSGSFLIGKSIDTTFNAFGTNQTAYCSSILKNILIDPKGDMCMAAYFLYHSDSFTNDVGPDMANYIISNESSFSYKYPLPVGSHEFKAQYVNENINFLNLGGGENIQISFDKENVKVEIGQQLIEIEQVFQPVNSVWIALHPKQQLAFKQELLSIIANEIGTEGGDNSSLELYQFISSIFFNEELLLNSLLTLGDNSFNRNLLNEFYYQDVIESKTPPEPGTIRLPYHKETFSQIDFIFVDDAKNKVKTNLDIL